MFGQIKKKSMKRMNFRVANSCCTFCLLPPFFTVMHIRATRAFDGRSLCHMLFNLFLVFFCIPFCSIDLLFRISNGCFLNQFRLNNSLFSFLAFCWPLVFVFAIQLTCFFTFGKISLLVCYSKL